MGIEDEKVRRSKVTKTIQVKDNIFISIRAEELTVYKVVRWKGRKDIVYTLDAFEGRHVVPILEKMVRRYA